MSFLGNMAMMGDGLCSPRTMNNQDQQATYIDPYTEEAKQLRRRVISKHKIISSCKICDPYELLNFEVYILMNSYLPICELLCCRVCNLMDKFIVECFYPINSAYVITF